jgi:hypothetical protein
MRYLPKIVYNAVTLNFTVRPRFWEPEEGAGLGDEDVSAAGVPESYWVRWDQACKITLRFKDTERADVMAWLEWAMKNKGTPFTFRFDSADAGTEYSVYLESPKTGERCRPTRNQNAPWTWEVEVTIRSTNSTRINVPIPLS